MKIKGAFLFMLIVIILAGMARASETVQIPGWQEYRVHGSKLVNDVLVWELCAGYGGFCETRVEAICLEPEADSPAIGSMYRWNGQVFVSQGLQTLGLVRVVGVLWQTFMPAVGR